MNANVPAPPQGFVPTNSSDYRAVLPRKAELAVLPDAVSECQNFASFSEVFGKTVPPQSTVVQLLNAAEQWSSMRAKSRAWDAYCATQEGNVWTQVRGLLTAMKPSFNLAVSVDATIATQLPSVETLLGVAKAIAQRGAVTRKANQKLEQEGQLPSKGKAGRKRKKDAAAAQAAIDAANKAAAAASHAATPTTGATPAVAVPPAASPAASTTPPPVSPVAASSTATPAASH